MRAAAAPGVVTVRVCSSGPSDGRGCIRVADCAGGACVKVQGICDDGSSAAQHCDCPEGDCSLHPGCSTMPHFGTCVGGALEGNCCNPRSNCGRGIPCVGAHHICLSGRSAGSACLNDTQCPHGTCGSTGMVCRGGSANGFACNADGDCPTGRCAVPVIVSTPTPRPPSSLGCLNTDVPTPRPKLGQFLCAGGHRNGRHCLTSMDCPGGGCAIAEGVCSGGVNNGFVCDCPGAACEPGTCNANPAMGTCRGTTAGTGSGFCCDPALSCGDAPCIGTEEICVGGSRKRLPCLGDSQCAGSSCVSIGRFCSGGTLSGVSCETDADCEDGSCIGSTLADVPTCRPDQLPTATPSRPPPNTRLPSNTPGPTHTIPPTSQSAGGGRHRSTGTSARGCAIAPATTAAPLIPLVFLLMLPRRKSLR